ncbi:MAG: DUF5683 domain-containing protein [Melioribacteraceae bacterium]|nr:DUF5683 domain-containing protein [Melioribacteraceae bacterium]
MKKTIFIILIFAVSIFAQESKLKLSGNISQDLLISSNNYQFDDSESNIVFKKRSPMLAAGMSVVLPGAGQFYNEDYWKTAIFVAIEVAAIAAAIIYYNKGEDQVASYEAFADSEAGWNVDKYANWTVDNANRLNSQIPEGAPVLDIFDNDGNVIWSRLNNLERTISGYYSHLLPAYGDQQYYELIGKYQQFNPGWNDFNYDDAYNYGDPLTPTFLWYADERGKANSYYDYSSLAVKVLITNHIISAVEAALAANSYNKSFKAEVKVQTNSIGYNRIFYPELSMSYRF